VGSQRTRDDEVRLHRKYYNGTDEVPFRSKISTELVENPALKHTADGLQETISIPRHVYENRVKYSPGLAREM
jgi:hypothetical protein